MVPPTTYPKAVAAELRAEMGRQQKTVAELADILGLERQAAKKRYDGDKPMSVDELATAAAWLGVERAVLYEAEAVAS